MAEETIIVTGEARLQELRDELEAIVKLTERAGEAALKMGDDEAKLSKQIHGLRAKVRLLIAASEKLSKVTKAEVVNAFSASTRGVKEMGKEYEKLFVKQRKLTAALRSETQASAKRNEAGKKGRADARADIDKAEKARARIAEKRKKEREREQKAELRAFEKQAAAQKKATEDLKKEAARQEATREKAAAKRNKDIERRIKDEERASARVASALRRTVKSEKRAVASKNKLNKALRQEAVDAKGTERAMRPLIRRIEELGKRAAGARKGVDKFGDELRDLKSQMNVAANSGRKLGRVLQNEIRRKSDKASASVRNLGRRQQKTNAAMSGFAHQIGVVFPKFGLLSQAVTGFNVAAGVAIGLVGLLAYEVGGRLKNAAVEYMKATRHGRAATKKFSDALADLQLIAGRWVVESTGLEGHMARLTVVMSTQSSIIARQKISMNDLAGATKAAAKEHSYLEIQLEVLAVALGGPIGLALVGMYELWRSITNEVNDSTAALRTWSRTAKHMKTLSEWQAYREKQKGFKDPGTGYYERVKTPEAMRRYAGQLVDLPGRKGQYRRLQFGERPTSPEDMQTFKAKGSTIEVDSVATITFNLGGKKHTFDDLGGLSAEDARFVVAEIAAGRAAGLTRKGRLTDKGGLRKALDEFGYPVAAEAARPALGGLLEGRVIPGAAQMGLGQVATDVVFTPGTAVVTGPRGRERRGGGGSRSLPQYPDAPKFMGTLGESFDKLLHPLSKFAGAVDKVGLALVRGPDLVSNILAFAEALLKLQEEGKSISSQFRDLRGLKGKALNKAMLAFSKTAPEAIQEFIDKAPVGVREQLQLFLTEVVRDATKRTKKGELILKKSGKKSLKHWDKFFGDFHSVYKRFMTQAVKDATKAGKERSTKEKATGSRSALQAAMSAVATNLQVSERSTRDLTDELIKNGLGVEEATKLLAKVKEERATIPGTPEQGVPIAERLLSVEAGKERAQARKDAMAKHTLEFSGRQRELRVQVLRVLSTGEGSKALALAKSLPQRRDKEGAPLIEFPRGTLATGDGTALSAILATAAMLISAGAAAVPTLGAAAIGMGGFMPEGFTLEGGVERGLIDPETGQIAKTILPSPMGVQSLPAAFLEAAGEPFKNVDEFLQSQGVEDIGERAKLIKDQLNLLLAEGAKNSVEVFTEQVEYAKDAIMDFGITGVEAFSQLAGAGELTAQSMKKTMLSMIGSLASSWGDYYIGLGIAQSANPLAPGSGAGMIVAGIALKALGGYLKGYASRSPGKSAGGAGASKSNTARDLLKREREERETIVEVFVMGDQVRDPIYRVVNEGIRRNAIQMRG